MKESDLLKISFCVSILGLLFLLGIDYYYNVDKVRISEITLREVGKEVVVEARVTRVTLKAENLFLEVKDSSGSISAVAFKSELRVRKGELVKIEGKISRYKNKPELIVTKLKMLRNDV